MGKEAQKGKYWYDWRFREGSLLGLREGMAWHGMAWYSVSGAGPKSISLHSLQESFHRTVTLKLNDCRVEMWMDLPSQVLILLVF